jgi:hypothetical protein
MRSRMVAPPTHGALKHVIRTFSGWFVLKSLAKSDVTFGQVLTPCDRAVLSGVESKLER